LEEEGHGVRAQKGRKIGEAGSISRKESVGMIKARSQGEKLGGGIRGTKVGVKR